MKTNPDPIRVVIVTVSDRSSRGERPDASGPALLDVANEAGWQVIHATIIPDSFEQIVKTLKIWTSEKRSDMILTTGGTGFSPRDVTPEATLAVIDRLTPGLAEAMRSASLKINPHAMLSRAVAGICNSTLIINLPGSPKGAVENLAVIQSVIPHAIQLIRDDPDSESGHLKLSDGKN